MRKDQNAKHDCLKLLVYEAEQHKVSVALIPNFEKGIAREKEICKEIDELKVLQEQDITGITEDKDLVREELVNTMYDVSGALQSYAHEKKMNALLEKVNFSFHNLDNLNKADICTIAAIILHEAEALAAEDLAAEGITAEELAGFKTLLETFNMEKNAPRKAIIERSNTTVKIANLIEEGWILKKNKLDKLVNQFKRKDPDFYNKYQAASQVIYRRSHRNNTNGDEEITNDEAEG